MIKQLYCDTSVSRTGVPIKGAILLYLHLFDAELWLLHDYHCSYAFFGKKQRKESMRSLIVAHSSFNDCVNVDAYWQEHAIVNADSEHPNHAQHGSPIIVL